MSTEHTIKVKEFIIENFMIDSSSDQLDHDQSFLESGIIDSTGMLELVSFIEETFDIKIEDGELIPDNLDSVNNVVKFIGNKTK